MIPIRRASSLWAAIWLACCAHGWTVKKTAPNGTQTVRRNKPQILLVGPNPMSIFADPTGKAFFQDPGAACNDAEEGDISQSVSAGR